MGFTEEWRIRGVMEIEGRVWDALNKREPIPIAGCSWGPLDGSEPLEPAPGLRSINPYDLIVALAVPAIAGMPTPAARGASIPTDVALDSPPLQIAGTVQLRSGEEPDALLMQPELFIPISSPVAFLDLEPLPVPEADVVLVNRGYVKSVRAVDSRTMEALRTRRPVP